MQHLERSGTPVPYTGRTVLRVNMVYLLGTSQTVWPLREGGGLYRLLIVIFDVDIRILKMKVPHS